MAVTELQYAWLCKTCPCAEKYCADGRHHAVTSILTAWTAATQQHKAGCRRHKLHERHTQLQSQGINSLLVLQNGPSISLWLTLFGVVAGFLSTFWSFGYTRLSRRLYRYLSTGPDDESKRVKKTDVLNTLMRGSWINVLGLGSTLLGLQATVGLLVAKTLTNATANPFLAGGAGSYNPVLALDVFLVQVCLHCSCKHCI